MIYIDMYKVIGNYIFITINNLLISKESAESAKSAESAESAKSTNLLYLFYLILSERFSSTKHPSINLLIFPNIPLLKDKFKFIKYTK